MNRICNVVLLSVLALAACAKSNDIARVEDEASVIVKYYRPRVERLGKRLGSATVRQRASPANAPGRSGAEATLADASNRYGAISSITRASADGRTTVELQATALAKEGSRPELEKLVDDTRDRLDDEIAATNDELSTVESWLGTIDAKAQAPAQPADTMTEAPPK